jgi:hypothetical protein
LSHDLRVVGQMVPSSKSIIRARSTGYCLNCKAQLSFCGKPFTADLICAKCGVVNVYQESQQPVRIKAGVNTKNQPTNA